MSSLSYLDCKPRLHPQHKGITYIHIQIQLQIATGILITYVYQVGNEHSNCLRKIRKNQKIQVLFPFSLARKLRVLKSFSTGRENRGSSHLVSQFEVYPEACLNKESEPLREHTLTLTSFTPNKPLTKYRWKCSVLKKLVIQSRTVLITQVLSTSYPP